MLWRIAKAYKTPDQLRKDPNVEVLGLEEVMEMAYQNIQTEAKNAIRRRRRPAE